MMAQVQRKVNAYFFGVEEPAVADQLTYYGSLVASAIMTVLSVVVAW